MISDDWERPYFIWTGYKDDENEGVFKTQTGEIAGWTNWGKNGGTGAQEPDGGQKENCVGLHSDDFLWHDLRCDRSAARLCIWYP